MSERKAPAATIDAEGPAAPPRSNGELVFEAPWEGRLFGITLALFEDGRFVWDEFRALLIDEIARFERDAPAGAVYRYYECWQAALERLLASKGLCAADELSDRTHLLSERPHGHDH